MRISRRRKQSIKQIVTLAGLIVLALIGWRFIHRPATLPADVYPYLTSLSPELVMKCQSEGKSNSPQAWAWLLAIRSTLPEQDTSPESEKLSQALKQALVGGTALSDHQVLTLLKPLSKSQQSLIAHCKEILSKYPYYQPNLFQFPFQDAVWYEDSFGASREGGKRQHQGTDLFAPEGTPIYSVSSGEVEQLGWNRLGGERVGIRGTDGNYYYYAHLETIAPDLQKGMAVEKGTLLGTMGHTGDALTTPDHLHFGIQLPNGEWINPYPFLRVWQSY